jgi:NAD(P)-dependent dehydrogenase (short-subunit alcohol dehydrogenase family)
MNNEKKIILVTGGSGGIGAEVVKKFVSNGYSAAINYLNSENIAIELRDNLINRFGNNSSILIKSDVSKRSDVNKMFDLIESELGTPSVLINCAGINRDRPFLEMTDDDWNSVVSIILNGTFNCSQEFARRYKGKNGAIINIGALTAIRGRKNGANYCSARAGVVNLTKCMAHELSPNIRVTCVTPGWINTDEVMERYELHNQEKYDATIKTIPMARLGTPTDIAGLIYFLVEESSYITGQNYLVDGGMLMY